MPMGGGISGYGTLTPCEPGEGIVDLVLWGYDFIIAGTWAEQDVTEAWSKHPWLNLSATLNDEIQYIAYLAAGTYTLYRLTQLSDNRGVMTISIDATPALVCDDYSGVGDVQNYVFSAVGIVIPTSGFHHITCAILDKNAGSSGYVTVTSSIALVRTA